MKSTESASSPFDQSHQMTYCMVRSGEVLNNGTARETRSPELMMNLQKAFVR